MWSRVTSNSGLFSGQIGLAIRQILLSCEIRPRTLLETEPVPSRPKTSNLKKKCKGAKFWMFFGLSLQAFYIKPYKRRKKKKNPFLKRTLEEPWGGEAESFIQHLHSWNVWKTAEGQPSLLICYFVLTESTVEDNLVTGINPLFCESSYDHTLLGDVAEWLDVKMFLGLFFS